MRLTLFQRLLGAFALVLLVGFGLSWVVGARRVAEDVHRDVRASLRAKAALLAEAAGQALDGRMTAAELQARIRALAPADDARYTVIRLDGEVLADSVRDPATMERHLSESRPELRDALERGVGEDTRTSESVRAEFMYVARRVDREGRPVGFARASLALTQEQERIAALRGEAAGAAAVAALAALALAWFFARRVSKAVVGLTRAAAAVADGDYGRHVPVPSTDELGRLAGTFNTMADQLRDRMASLTRERSELMALLAGMVEGVVAVDREERVVLMNDAARRILGGGDVETQGRPIWEVTRLREVGETLADASRTGAAQVREARLVRTPRDRFLRLHAAPLGGGAGAVLVVHDISELRHLEMVRRDFVANVSHELKTPLAAVRGFVETILDDGAMDPATRKRFLERIREQTLRLSRMVEELLTLSRVESEESEVARSPTDVRGPVREAVQSVTPAAQRKSLSLRLETPETATPVPANEEALRRIVGNLLDNAVKYTPTGGAVVVRVLPVAREVLLEVEDTGPGIPERERERVFERFYRVDKGRSRDAGGTGLGLAIVKHLVRALGGTVLVEAAPSGGSLFRVRLPSA